MREKLIELLCKMISPTITVGEQADFLIANGVTVQEWIPVKDRLPDIKKVIDGETYFKHVVVLVKHLEYEQIAFYDDNVKCWFGTDFFPVFGEVTHWMPLPEPPKGE